MPSEMHLFVAVVRAGSYTAAAERLGLAKQTVSARVAALEQRLGARLLERTTRRLRLTEAGAVYADRCATILGLIDEANAEVQSGRMEPHGTLRISAPVLYGRRFLAPSVSAYLRRYPSVRVQLELSNRYVDLLAENFDLAIRVGDLDASSLSARKIDDGDVHIVASPRLSSEIGPLRLAQLAKLRCVGMSPVETWSSRAASVRVEPVLVVNDLELACEAAIDGVGVARLPMIVCREAVAKGKLKILFGGAPAEVRPVHVVYPSRSFLPAKVRAFVDVLVERGPRMTKRARGAPA